ncbi:unnamed protein product [Closterium sp. Yama58-4]|nr:unnamed protein product [Closterium sp. Yama58-4]
MYGLDQLPPQNFCNSRLLKTLHLKGWFHLTSFPDSLGQPANLTRLSIIGCRTRFQLPESISNLLVLLTLEFSHCEDLSQLPESLVNLPALETRLQLLSVIKCPDLISLSDSLSHLPSLTDLSLLRLTLRSLPHSVGQLPHLRTLKRWRFLPLASHRIPRHCTQRANAGTIQSFTALKELTLSDLTSLKVLKIVDCSLLTQLPDSISLLTSLDLLEINYYWNLTALPQDMGKGLHSLCKLILVRCLALTHLPPSLSSVSSLETLDIHRATRLRGSLPCGLTSLKDLSLYFLPHLPALPASLPSIGGNLTSPLVSNCNRIKALTEQIGRLGALEKLAL